MTRSRKYYKSQKLRTYIWMRAKLGHTHTHTEFIINNLNFSHDYSVTPVLDSFLLSVSFVKCSRSQQTAVTELCAEGVNNANHSQGWKREEILELNSSAAVYCKTSSRITGQFKKKRSKKVTYEWLAIYCTLRTSQASSISPGNRYLYDRWFPP